MARIARLNPLTNRTELFAPSGEHVERFHDEESEVTLKEEGDQEQDELGSFDILAFTGVAVDRWWGKLVLDTDGIRHGKQTTLLLEHNDHAPIGVCMEHLKEGRGRLRLRGHFLRKEASPEAYKLRMQCAKQAPGKPGIKLKSSVGVRFEEYRFLEKGEELEVNGKKHKHSEDYDTLVVSKCFLFENSVIYVNPADLGTDAAVMRHQGAASMKPDPNSATAAVLAASQSPTGAPVAPAAAPAPIVRFSDLAAENRKLVLDEARASLEAERKAFEAAFPEPELAEWRESMRASGKTIEQAKLARYEQLEADRRATQTEEKLRQQIVGELGASIGRDGRGFSEAGAERRAAAGIDFSILEDAKRQASERLHKNPALVAFFGHSALDVVSHAVSYELRANRASLLDDSERGRPSFDDSEILSCAKLLLAATPTDKLARIQRLASGGAGGHGALDLAVITVKGFLDGYHNAMEKENAWGVDICYTADSNQETEIVRWLGYANQLQPFQEKGENQNVPNYQVQFTNIWYDATLELDVQDFQLQKFGKIDQLCGQQGAVHKKHWNKLIAAQLEANNVCYDGKTLFHKSHAMGGKAPVAQSNDLSVANGQGFLAIPDVGNMTSSQMNQALLLSAPFLRNYFAANGEPLNEEEKREICVIVPEKFSALAEDAVYSKRLDGSPGGAGGSRDNAIQVESERRGDRWRVVSTPRLASQSVAAQGYNYIYMALLGNDRKPFLRAEPIGLSMFFAGPGSEMHRLKNKYGFWGRTMRSTAPGAWSSILRIQLGA